MFICMPADVRDSGMYARFQTCSKECMITCIKAYMLEPLSAHHRTRSPWGGGGGGPRPPGGRAHPPNQLGGGGGTSRMIDPDHP